MKEKDELILEVVEDTESDDDLVLEMSNKYQKETGLPMNIWIDENQAYIKGKHGKRIKFQVDTSTRNKSNESWSMGLDGTIYPNNNISSKLHNQHLTQLRNFVHNNRFALDRIADEKIKICDIWPYIIKGGERASEESIMALNNKVRELEIAEEEEAKRELEMSSASKKPAVRNRHGRKHK